MVKTKKTQVTGKRVTNGRLIDSLKTKAEVDMLGGDDWVIVKKQVVNILVPPLPVVKKSISSSPEQSQPQDLSQKTTNKPSQFQIEKAAQMPSAEQEKSISPASLKNTEIATTVTAEHNSTLIRQPRPQLRVESENLDRTGTSRTGKIIGVSNTSKAIQRPRVLHYQDRFLGGGMVLNQRMRASNLERKLEKAGGLSRWLASLGLGQFARLSKFQLVNLTMKKLKDMGADKVGPRRKLMHAIDCICQPYCFEAFKNGY